jgi:hypothetical protein
MDIKQFDRAYGSGGREIAVNELREKLEDPHLEAVAMLIEPLRPGVRIFSATVEWELYTPHTSANSLFQVIHMFWEGFVFSVAVYQKDDRPEINKIARRFGLHLRNGYPQLIPFLGQWALASGRRPLDMKAKLFPVRHPGLYTLEFVESAQPKIFPSKDFNRLLRKENEHLRELYTRHGVAEAVMNEFVGAFETET